MANRAQEGANDDAQTVIRVPIVYSGLDDLPINFANAFLIQQTSGKEEFLLSIGHIAPPVLIGDKEEVAEQAKKITYVQAKMLGRYGMTEERFRELVSVLSGYLEKYDVAKKAGKER